MFLLCVLCVYVVCPVCVPCVVAPEGLGGFSLGFVSPPRLGCFPFSPVRRLILRTYTTYVPEAWRLECAQLWAQSLHGARRPHMCGTIGGTPTPPPCGTSRPTSFSSVRAWRPPRHTFPWCGGNPCSYHGAWRSFCDNKETPRAGNDSHCGAR